MSSPLSILVSVVAAIAGKLAEALFAVIERHRELRRRLHAHWRRLAPARASRAAAPTPPASIAQGRVAIHEHPNVVDALSDWLSVQVFSPASFVFHALWFGVWLGLHLDINTLTMIVSLEAIFIGVVIGNSQNRQASRDRKRDDTEAIEVADLTDMNRTQLDILAAQNAMLAKIARQDTLIGDLKQTILDHIRSTATTTTARPRAPRRKAGE